MLGLVTDSVNNSPHELTSWSLIATPQPKSAPAQETALAADLALLAWLDLDSSDDNDNDPMATQVAEDLALMLVA